MQFVTPQTPEDAIAKLGGETVIASKLSSAEWRDEVWQPLRENAFFSSQIESARVLQKAQDLLGDFVAANRETLTNGEVALKVGSRSAFVDQMQEFLAANRIERSTGDLKDITSEARLGLIFDVKTTQAFSFAYWKQGLDPDVLDEFPAMRFIRVADVKEPRQSHAQYENQVFLKTDPIWARVINEDFGVPFAPFGFGCQHDTEDVDRAEAEALGLLQPGERVAPPAADLNENLQASTKNIEPELLDKLRDAFGEQAVFEGDTVRWLGQPSAKVGDELTKRDEAALLHYTAGDNHDINEALRSGGDAPIFELKKADALSTALAKLPEFNGEVVRHTYLPSDVLKDYLPGNVVTDRGFVSTTTGPALFDFGDTVEIQIVSKTGRLISKFSVDATQQEVLFDQGTKFKVLARHVVGKKMFIRLEEL